MAQATSGRWIVAGVLALVVGAGALLLLAARAAQQGPPPARMPVAIAPGAIPDPESEGARLLQRHCVGCHGIPDPAQHPAARWPASLAEMERRMHAAPMRAVPIPTREGWQVLKAYLQAHAADRR